MRARNSRASRWSDRVPAKPRVRIFSWACFDFANSAFGTLIGTFIYATYFTKGISENYIEGTRSWGNAIALSAILIAVLSPPLGALADAYAWKRRLMFAMICLCSAGSVALYFPQQGDVLWALSLFVVANTAIELAIVFNNGFLPELAPPEKQGKVSGMAWGFGYLGGLLCLGIALVGFVMPEEPWFGLSKEGAQNVRATCLLVGAWVLVFSLPMALWLHEKKAPSQSDGWWNVGRRSFGRLIETLSHVRRYRKVFWLLVARAFYNDGLVTVFAFGAIYATGTFGFEQTDVIVFGIVLNVCAGLGAFAFGFLEDRIGSRTTVMISLVCLVACSSAAIFVQSQSAFWVCAIFLGIFIGPNQSASRVFLSRIAPEEKASEFFGFFAMSGKVTAFIGPFLCGQLTAQFGTQRAGMAVVPALMVLGLAIFAAKTGEKREA